MTVSNLDDHIAQFQLQQGTLEFRVRRLPNGNIVEVDTPNLAFTVTRAGQYRVFVDAQDGSTTVSVRSGSADVYGENASYAVATGQAYRFYGTDLRDSEIASLPPPDTFDRFVAERDRRYESNVSLRYVRHVERAGELRQRLVPAHRAVRVGAIPRRPLGVDRSVGMDVGR